MFSSLPSDVHNLIYSSLSFKDIGIMHQVSKVQNTAISNNLSEQKRREQIFKDRFGAFASHENTQEIRNHTARRYNRLKEISQADLTHILKFDNGMPILVKPTNQPEKISWWQNIKSSYLEWRLESPDDSVNDEIRKIFNEHIVVLNDLFTRPLDKEFPLQDYRDRMIRRLTIHEERLFLLNLLGSCENRRSVSQWLTNHWDKGSRTANLEYICNVRFPFEKDRRPFQIVYIAFAIFYLVHRIFSPRLIELQLPKYENSDLSKNSNIEIESQSTSVPLKIIATPKIHFFRRYYNQIKNPEFSTQFSIKGHGTVTLERTWVNVNQDQVFEGHLFSNESLTDPALTVTIDSENSTSDDTLMQLALEIFKREPENKLCVIAYDPDSITSFTRRWPIYKEVNLTEGNSTKLYTFHNSNKIPAKSTGTKTKWEQIIAERPLLKGTAPILPKFWEHDLSKQMDSTSS